MARVGITGVTGLSLYHGGILACRAARCPLLAHSSPHFTDAEEFIPYVPFQKRRESVWSGQCLRPGALRASGFGGLLLACRANRPGHFRPFGSGTGIDISSLEPS